MISIKRQWRNEMNVFVADKGNFKITTFFVDIPFIFLEQNWFNFKINLFSLYNVFSTSSSLIFLLFFFSKKIIIFIFLILSCLHLWLRILIFNTPKKKFYITFSSFCLCYFFLFYLIFLPFVYLVLSSRIFIIFFGFLLRYSFSQKLSS